MEVELEQWLDIASENVSNSQNLPAASDISDKVALVGGYIFGLGSTASVDDVEQRIFEFFPDLDSNEELPLDFMVEYLLVISVSQQCEKRNEFVRQIMNMDGESQTFLMQIIQEHLSQKQSDAENEPENQNSEIQTKSSKSVPQKQSQEEADEEEQAADQETMQCQVCEERHATIQKLQQELKTQNENSTTMINKLKDSLSVEAAKVVDNEVLLIDKDKQIYNLQQSIDQQKKQLSELDKLNGLLADKKQQLLALQDELDCLKPKAMKSEQLETMVSKLRDRLEEYNELKAQLKQEQSQHQETYAKYLQYHDEVNELRKCKIFMEQYREELMEIQINFDELKLRYDDLEKERNSLKQQVAQLQGHELKQLQDQSHYLTQQLQATNEELRESSRGTGIGEGMNEFNSSLVQELNLLKQEKEQLSTLLQASSVESLTKLTKENEDLKSLSSSLQQKLFNTKNVLAETQSTLSATQSSLALLTSQYHTLQSNYAILLEEHLTTQGMAQEDRLMHLRRHQEDLAIIAGLRTELREMTTWKESLEMTVEQHVVTQQEMQITYADKLKQLKATQEQLLQEQNTIHTMKMEQMKGEYENALDYQQQLNHQINEQLEDEIMKKRKIEKLKNHYFSESKRLKLHCTMLNEEGANANGGGFLGVSSRKIDSGRQTKPTPQQEQLIAQVKALQTQLAAANQEIVTLKETQTTMTSVPSSTHTHTTDNKPPAASTRGMSTVASQLKATSNSRIAAARSALSRPARVPSIQPSSLLTMGTPTANKGSTGTTTVSSSMTPNAMQTYLEQSELNDKRVEQLEREKRELISRSMEERNEKNELSQKLLIIDKENDQLKNELRKITLDKERLERQLLKHNIALPPKSSTLSSRSFDKENRIHH